MSDRSADLIGALLLLLMIAYVHWAIEMDDAEAEQMTPEERDRDWWDSQW